MRLQKLQYSEYVGTPQEWILEELSFNSKNLIVGKNATGKSRALNVVSNLARQLAGLSGPSLSSQYHCVFDHENKKYDYLIESDAIGVTVEQLSVDGIKLINRSVGGEGTIFAEELRGGEHVKFQTAVTELAAVARRDTIQHRYLEPLFQWASDLRYYQFGTRLGKDTVGIRASNEVVQVDERDPNSLVPLLRKATAEFQDTFVQMMIEDMAVVGYVITEIGTAPPISVRFSGLPGEALSIFVQESDLQGVTDQHSMSVGMFRALALLVRINYAQLKKTGACVLIDDIGEGLDFDRSCRLIDLLRDKADKSNIQIVMSTNDRFVMNKVPLEEWTVLQRIKNHVYARNYENSKEIFEEFKYTGLSNFSFLELDVIGDSSISVR